MRGWMIMVAMLCAGTASAQSINAGERAPDPNPPFDSQTIAQFDTPWALAFLPDGRMLVTEKPGALYLVTQGGQKTRLAGVPDVDAAGQNGLLDVAIAPDFAQSRTFYLTYVADGRLTLARARLGEGQIDDLAVLWRQNPAGGRGQPGGIIAFDPQGQHMFLSVGDRMQPETAQDPTSARGKVLRFDLAFAAPETWTSGHRNPYGLAFDPAGRLWLHEMGPRGGDEFNLIVQGANYGWPIVSNGDNYNGAPIPDHATRPEFAAPALYWTPVIAPAGLIFYKGDLFADWQGSALIGALAGQALVQVTLGPNGTADQAARWDMNARIRDLAEAPDGALWLIEDAGALRRLIPKN